MTPNHADVRLVPVRTAAQVGTCEELWTEYGEWATGEYLRLTGRQVQPDHQGFRDELPDLMSGRGRLYLAELNGVPVGTGGLKITTPDFAESARAGITNDAVYLELMISPGTTPGTEQETR